MDVVFSLVEKLVALAHPTIVGLQSLLGVTLLPVSNANQYWSFYEAHSSSGLVTSVDFREPAGGTSKYEPLVVVTLRDAPVRFRDLSRKYGQGRITDLSHHHHGLSATRMSCTARTLASKSTQRARESWHFQSTTQQLRKAARTMTHGQGTLIDSCNLLPIKPQKVNRGRDEDAGLCTA